MTTRPALTTLQIDSPLGPLRLFAADAAICGIFLPNQRPTLVADAGPPAPVLQLAADQLREYFAGTRRSFTVPLQATGTDFQHTVWRALLTIPHGETRSYGALAHAIARPTASRAVGHANSKNPISILVPCHRVIGSDGALTGYAGGAAAKQWLLAHEATTPR
jgi:methylated-DNA-[protein]-cysteine S-methyltransferase